MKKKIWILVLVLLCMFTTCAAASGYKLGDKVDDFTVTLDDGTTFTLSDALAQGKPVMLNFWATWCMPCQGEMPAIEAASAQLAGQAEIVALTVEETDDVEALQEIRNSLGLVFLPMGFDTNAELYDSFDDANDSIPFTVIIDKNGVLCFTHEGAEQNESKFINLLSIYTAEDYSEPQLLEDFPELKPDVENPSSEAVHQAIGAADMVVKFSEDEMVWPFVAAEDGASLYAANLSRKDTTAEISLTVDAKAGEAIAFEYQSDVEPIQQAFSVLVDGEMADVMAGKHDWTDNAVTFAADGEHTVTFRLVRDAQADGAPLAAIRNVRKVTGDEAAAILAARPQGVKTLEGSAAEFTVVEGDAKDAQLTFNGQSAAESGALDADSMTGGAAEHVLLSDTLTLHISIGQDVDPNYAYIFNGTSHVLLANLPTDETGYLYTYDKTSPSRASAVNLGKFIYLYPDVRVTEAPESIASFHFAISEADMDQYVESLSQLLTALSPEGTELPALDWEYSDGSARTTEKAQ